MPFKLPPKPKALTPAQRAQALALLDSGAHVSARDVAKKIGSTYDLVTDLYWPLLMRLKSTIPNPYKSEWRQVGDGCGQPVQELVYFRKLDQ